MAGRAICGRVLSAWQLPSPVLPELQEHGRVPCARGARRDRGHVGVLPVARPARATRSSSFRNSACAVGRAHVVG